MSVLDVPDAIKEYCARFGPEGERPERPQACAFCDHHVVWFDGWRRCRSWTYRTRREAEACIACESPTRSSKMPSCGSCRAIRGGNGSPGPSPPLRTGGCVPVERPARTRVDRCHPHSPHAARSPRPATGMSRGICESRRRNRDEGLRHQGREQESIHRGVSFLCARAFVSRLEGVNMV